MINKTDMRSKESTTQDAWDCFFSHATIDHKFCFEAVTKHNDNLFTFFGDLEDDLFYISDNMRDTFGFSSNLVFNLIDQWKSRIHGNVWREKYEQDIRSMLDEGRQIHDLRYVVEDVNGRIMWIRCYGTLKWSDDGATPLYFAGRIVKQDDRFVIDPSSNFLSATTLLYQMEEWFSQHRRLSAIGFCINHISHLNKIYGQQVVDQMLVKISQRIMDELSHQFAFYRLSGIRFVGIADATDKSSLEEAMGIIRNIVREEYAPLTDSVEQLCSFVTISLPNPRISLREFQGTMVSLLQMASKLPKLPYIDDSQRNMQKVHLYEEMETALCQDALHGMQEFYAVVQPIVAEGTGKVIGGETLLRWSYQGNDVSPAIFVPELEENGLIQLAGRWIFEQAIIACSKIVPVCPDFYLTVNLSLHQLHDAGLMEFVPETLHRYGLSGTHIVIELTESCMDREPKKLKLLMNRFQTEGIRFALDDFGTGYSSLRALMQYPTSIIKLDRSLLLEMSQSQEKTEFINSIVYACHQFGKKVCMEGVETPEQISLAHGANCDMIQGFYYHRPTPLPELYRLMSQP